MTTVGSNFCSQEIGSLPSDHLVMPVTQQQPVSRLQKLIVARDGGHVVMDGEYTILFLSRISALLVVGEIGSDSTTRRWSRRSG